MGTVLDISFVILSCVCLQRLHLLTLGTHVQRGLQQLSVCVCVCLLSHISPLERLFGPENTVMYSVGNGGQNICGVFSETAPLWRSSTASIESHTYGWPFFCGKHICAL